MVVLSAVDTLTLLIVMMDTVSHSTNFGLVATFRVILCDEHPSKYLRCAQPFVLSLFACGGNVHLIPSHQIVLGLPGGVTAPSLFTT